MMPVYAQKKSNAILVTDGPISHVFTAQMTLSHNFLYQVIHVIKLVSFNR